MRWHVGACLPCHRSQWELKGSSAWRAVAAARVESTFHTADCCHVPLLLSKGVPRPGQRRGRVSASVIGLKKPKQQKQQQQPLSVQRLATQCISSLTCSFSLSALLHLNCNTVQSKCQSSWQRVQLYSPLLL